MRGKDKNDDFGVQQIRITPAYAGKSSVTSSEPSDLIGSPPPMRGKEDQWI